MQENHDTSTTSLCVIGFSNYVNSYLKFPVKKSKPLGPLNDILISKLLLIMYYDGSWLGKGVCGLHTWRPCWGGKIHGSVALIELLEQDNGQR